jgi:hypothetical protein
LQRLADVVARSCHQRDEDGAPHGCCNRPPRHPPGPGGPCWGLVGGLLAAGGPRAVVVTLCMLVDAQ